MRTVCGLARRVQRLVGRDRGAAVAVAPLVMRGRPLLSGAVGDQRHSGVQLDQVDGTTCGSAVLVALSAWSGPGELARLEPGGPDPVVDGIRQGFGARYDARQLQVHRETNRWWPRALGTSPWGMTHWLRRNAPDAGDYRVRLVDDVSGPDVEDTLAAVSAALLACRPVPLLVGAVVPRHYCLLLGAGVDGRWQVYEPTSGQVREVDPAAVAQRRLGPTLGYDRLHAVLLPGS